MVLYMNQTLFHCIHQHLGKPFSIIRDQQLSSSREALKASRKHLKKEGKGNKPNASDVLNIEQVFELGALGDSDTLWT